MIPSDFTRRRCCFIYVVVYLVLAVYPQNTYTQQRRPSSTNPAPPHTTSMGGYQTKSRPRGDRPPSRPAIRPEVAAIAGGVGCLALLALLLVLAVLLCRHRLFKTDQAKDEMEDSTNRGTHGHNTLPAGYKYSAQNGKPSQKTELNEISFTHATAFNAHAHAPRSQTTPAHSNVTPSKQNHETFETIREQNPQASITEDNRFGHRGHDVTKSSKKGGVEYGTIINIKTKTPQNDKSPSKRNNNEHDVIPSKRKNNEHGVIPSKRKNIEYDVIPQMRKNLGYDVISSKRKNVPDDSDSEQLYTIAE